MKQGTFDITSLEKASKKLAEILIRYEKDFSDDAIRDSVIQRFEFTYSIAIKTIRKYLIERAFVVEDINQMSFNEMVRTANQLNLLKSNLELWTEFREMRNLTSHTYDEVIAEKVVAVVPKFHEEIIFLINNLKNNE
ncbi:MAG: nucleotidyltransferase [Cyanobacteria bacterium SIG28]|nr:nucleotidyltransferase [Cyanobacteria bacterium SIG28]